MLLSIKINLKRWGFFRISSASLLFIAIYVFIFGYPFPIISCGIVSRKGLMAAASTINYFTVAVTFLINIRHRKTCSISTNVLLNWVHKGFYRYVFTLFAITALLTVYIGEVASSIIPLEIALVALILGAFYVGRICYRFVFSDYHESLVYDYLKDVVASEINSEGDITTIRRAIKQLAEVTAFQATECRDLEMTQVNSIWVTAMSSIDSYTKTNNELKNLPIRIAKSFWSTILENITFNRKAEIINCFMQIIDCDNESCHSLLLGLGYFLAEEDGLTKIENQNYGLERFAILFNNMPIENREKVKPIVWMMLYAYVIRIASTHTRDYTTNYSLLRARANIKKEDNSQAFLEIWDSFLLNELATVDKSTIDNHVSEYAIFLDTARDNYQELVLNSCIK